MKLFFKVTAILEGLTGLALILVPQLLIQILVLSSLEEIGGIIVAKIAGAAIMIIALLCWFNEVSKFTLLLKLLVFYNIAVAIIALYSVVDYEIKAIGLVAVISLHTILAIWGIILFKNAQINQQIKINKS